MECRDEVSTSLSSSSSFFTFSLVPSSFVKENKERMDEKRTLQSQQTEEAPDKRGKVRKGLLLYSSLSRSSFTCQKE